MTGGPDCAVMCNVINTHTHTHTTSFRRFLVTSFLVPFSNMNYISLSVSNSTTLLVMEEQGITDPELGNHAIDTQP